MKYKNLFHLFSEVLKRAKIPFVLIGGFAVNFYKFSRTTGDVDFMMTEVGFNQAWPFLEKAGCRLMIRTPLFATLKSDIPPFMLADILFVDEKTIKGVLAKTSEAQVMGEKLQVPSLEHLIALKLHALKNNLAHRESRDLRDIMELVKQHQIDVKTKSFRHLCQTYGTDEIYKKICRVTP